MFRSHLEGAARSRSELSQRQGVYLHTTPLPCVAHRRTADAKLNNSFHAGITTVTALSAAPAFVDSLVSTLNTDVQQVRPAEISACPCNPSQQNERRVTLGSTFGLRSRAGSACPHAVMYCTLGWTYQVASAPIKPQIAPIRVYRTHPVQDSGDTHDVMSITTCSPCPSPIHLVFHFILEDIPANPPIKVYEIMNLRKFTSDLSPCSHACNRFTHVKLKSGWKW